MRGAFTIVNGRKVYESSRRAKRNWKLRNRDRVNARRREVRLARRAAMMGDRKCALCTRLLRYGAKSSIKYCSHCRRDNRKDIRAMEPSNFNNGRRVRSWMKREEVMRKPTSV